MTHRRIDAIYFLAFSLVVLAGFLFARADSEADAKGSVEVPQFSFPSIEIEAPFELTYSFVKFKRPKPPTLHLTENTESVRRELRSALLETSSLIEVEEESQLAAVVEGRD